MEPNSASEDQGSLQSQCNEVVEGEIPKLKQNRADRYVYMCVCIYIYIYQPIPLSPFISLNIHKYLSLSLSLSLSKTPNPQTVARIYQDIFKKTTIYSRQSNEIYHCFNPLKSLIFSPVVSSSSIFGQISNL